MTDGTKACPVCGEEIKEAALKCRFCNEDLEKFAKRKVVAIERILWTGSLPMFFSVGQIVMTVFLFLLFIIPGAVYLLCLYLASKSKKYVVTTQRITIETGLFSKGGENIELFRVDDFGANTPFGMKLMGFGLLIVQSSDRTARPNTAIVVPLDKQRELAIEVRQAIFDQRELRGIMTLAKS